MLNSADNNLTVSTSYLLFRQYNRVNIFIHFVISCIYKISEIINILALSKEIITLYGEGCYLCLTLYITI